MLQLAVGDEIFWDDPDEGLCSRHATIAWVSNYGDIVRFTDGTEAFAAEIDPIHNPHAAERGCPTIPSEKHLSECSDCANDLGYIGPRKRLTNTPTTEEGTQ